MNKISAIITCIGLLIFSATCAAEEQRKKNVISSENGRFAFGQISDFRADQFMLDTKTGRLWQLVVSKPSDGSGENRLLQEVPYINMNGTISSEPK